MGVKLKDIIVSHPISISELRTKQIAIDAYNTIYQFLTTIRGYDGFYLSDNENNITSHLAGLFYRTSYIIMNSIFPVYVFDGKPNPLKEATLESRFHMREKAMNEWKTALVEGDMDMAYKKARQSTRITSEIVESSKELLSYMGIPYLTANSDGEALSAYLSRKGSVWASASQDYDSLIYNATRIVRNFAVERKKSSNKVDFEIIYTDEVLNNLGITHEQLIDIAILVGTDFNEGVMGIGPKKALSLIKKFGKIEDIEGIDISSIPYKEVREIFKSPNVEEFDSFNLKWGKIDKEGLLHFLCDKHNFSKERIKNVIDKLPSSKQSNLDSF